MTADEVAAVIVAACRETGEDPMACAAGSVKTCRARHYAMHALAEAYPPRGGYSEDRALIARVCGVRWNQHIKPEYTQYNYFSTSLNQVFRPFVNEYHPEKNAPHWARWFNDVVHNRVRAALAQVRIKQCELPGHQRHKVAPAANAEARNTAEDTCARAVKELASQSVSMIAAPVAVSEKSAAATVQRRVSPVLGQERKSTTPLGTRLTGALNLRREAAPITECADLTGTLMGDPPPAQSALQEYLERERARQLRGELDE